MRRESLAATCAILTAALALLLPAAAPGKEGSAPAPTGFQLRGSNGFALTAWTVVPPRAGEGWIGLLLVRGRQALVSYAAPATVTATTIEADLGKLGRISVGLVPTGRQARVRLSCEAKAKTPVEAQRYEGTIEFHGEEGFSDVSATAAPALYPKTCDVPGDFGAAPKEALPGARLDAERPPAPFAGHGSFHATPRADRWSGNLTVDFPGHADVPVTGPGFSASLEHPRR